MGAPYRIPDQTETDRYALRRVVPSDAAPIFYGYATDRSVTRYLGWRPHTSLAETTAFIERVSPEWDTGRGFPMVVCPHSEPESPIGMFHAHVRGSTMNYSYVLRANAWGKGCATEVLRWLVDHALNHQDIFRAQAFCDVENSASARVMEKAGMSREGILRRYFLHPNVSDTPRDCLIYAKVK